MRTTDELMVSARQQGRTVGFAKGELKPWEATVAACILSVFVSIGLMIVVGNPFYMPWLIVYIGYPAVACFACAVWAERIRFSPFKTLLISVLVLFLCTFMHSRFSGLVIKFLGVLIVGAMDLIVISLSEFIVGLVDKVQGRLSFRRGAARGAVSAVLFTLVTLLIGGVSTPIKALPAATVLFIAHMVVWIQLDMAKKQLVDEKSVKLLSAE